MGWMFRLDALERGGRYDAQAYARRLSSLGLWCAGSCIPMPAAPGTLRTDDSSEPFPGSNVESIGRWSAKTCASA